MVSDIVLGVEEIWRRIMSSTAIGDGRRRREPPRRPAGLARALKWRSRIATVAQQIWAIERAPMTTTRVPDSRPSIQHARCIKSLTRTGRDAKPFRARHLQDYGRTFGFAHND